VLAKEKNMTGGRLRDAAEDVNQGRFTRPVRPYQSVDLSLFHQEAYTIEGTHTAKVSADFNNFQH
jgi:hypothetical protein